MANWDANMSVNARAAFCFLAQATPHLKAANEAAGGGDKVGSCTPEPADAAKVGFLSLC
jgi:hypothetical protein